MTSDDNPPVPAATPAQVAAPASAASASAAEVPRAAAPAEDPWLWLEEVDSDRALAWVRERNAESLAELTQRPLYAELLPRFRAALDARDRIPAITRRGRHVYNFWRDEAHPRGVWRRTTLADYRKAAPAWELLLDLDQLATREGENWVWAGAACLPSDPNRCLLSLSRGGADAVVVREYDLARRAFVAGGFELPEAKSDVSWEDADHVLVGTDFGPGSLTSSGYPRVIKRWRRGEPLARARTVFEGQASDVSAWASVEHRPGLRRVTVGRSLDFYTTEVFLLDGERRVPLPKPADASLALHGRWATLELRSDWAQADGKVWRAGSLLVGPAAALAAGKPQWTPVFSPTPTVALASHAWTRQRLVLTLQDQVAHRVEVLDWVPGRRKGSGAWQARPLALPGPGTLSVAPLHDAFAARDALAEALLVQYVDFLTPDTLYLARADARPRTAAAKPARLAPALKPGAAAARAATTAGAGLEVLKRRLPQFDAAGLVVERRQATSADGTRVPYFVVRPRAAVALAGAGAAAAPRPTLLYGYGGFEISLLPWYSAIWGEAWYSRGGVLVVANIRGGGEFGPAWHQAATKATKQRSIDDFVAVAEDLIGTGLTDAAHLGIMGGSNGGLLVGAAFTQRPELFKAVVCQVPLLDMRRYHRLLAGASWMAEYGDPDQPADWAHLQKLSPYHQLQAGRRYPRVLFTTSTRDDRVHPGHARKMVARMRELGAPPLYYENIEGGHGGAADNAQRAQLSALEFSYLWAELAGR